MATSTLEKSTNGRVRADQPGFMTEKDRSFFHEQGYLVIEDALSAEEIARFNEETAGICRGQFGTYGGWAGPHDGQSDDEVLRQYLCIHMPHKISTLFQQAIALPPMREVLESIIGPDVKCMQSMLFIKAAGKPGQAWHQDEDYIPTRDRSLTGGWIALDDATVDNGCLWVLPGSHRPGVLWPQRVQEDRRFDCAQESFQFPYRDEDAVPVEVKAGSIVFFNGYLLHRSLPNRLAGGYRRALVNHYMSAQSLLPWGAMPTGGPAATADYRDVVMVCGKDPYAWKGYEDVARPHVRASGEGGCGSPDSAAKPKKK